MKLNLSKFSGRLISKLQAVQLLLSASGFTYGTIAFAAFLIAAFSGLFLAFSFDIRNPYDSVTLILLFKPAASLFRNLHYWSAQIFLITTFLHAWDHIQKKTGRPYSLGLWSRLSLSLLVSVFLMLTGFIVKGDADSLQAREILSSLLKVIPLAGKTLSFIFLGRGNDLQIPYFHHIAAAFVFLWFAIYEHTKKLWPAVKTAIYIFLFSFLVSLFFTPSVHDNFSSNMRGPWYLLGLQEAFHWLKWPSVIIAAVFFLTIILIVLPAASSRISHYSKVLIKSSILLYFGLCLFAFFFRGDNWSFRLPFYNIEKSDFLGIKLTPFYQYSKSDSLYTSVPVIMGRREGCLCCHRNVKGLSASHDPSVTGCYSCHSGNPFSLDKTTAHRSMILIPGNLENAALSCGNQKCHPDIPRRVENSIMNTMSGVISVDKYVFDEIEQPSGLFNIKKLKQSPADNHLKNLCASCHLGAEKSTYGEIREESRGGGCLACHLNYSPESKSDMQKLTSGKKGTYDARSASFHPDINIKITSIHCFGCHSRSGRISLNYEGWHETSLTPAQMPQNGKYRLLDDGRVVTRITPDIHSEKGMICTDCHISKEIMGDGNRYEHKEQQLIVACTDCHNNKMNFSADAQADFETNRLLFLRGLPLNNRYVLTEKNSKSALYNVLPDSAGTPWLKLKNTSARLPLRKPVPQCNASEIHSRLSCNTCHSSWAPQCIGCHTRFRPDMPGYDLLNNKDIMGSWQETPGDFLPDPPVLGIRTVKGKNGTEKEIVDNFVPGMILSIDKSKYKNAGSLEYTTVFKRLFAPAFSHTVRRESRTCQSCHSNPLALGYGRGELKYQIAGKTGRWVFIPAYKKNNKDMLPEDAWIGFLEEPKNSNSTRNGAHPFTLADQKKILTIGSCFFCHNPESFYIWKHLNKSDWNLKHLSPKCILPSWQIKNGH